MIIVVPFIDPVLMGDAWSKYEEVKSKPETIYNFAARYPKLGFEAKTWRPIKA